MNMNDRHVRTESLGGSVIRTASLPGSILQHDPLSWEWQDVDHARATGKWRGIDALPDGWDVDSADAIADLVTFRL